MNILTIKDKNCLIAQSLGWVECDWAPVESIPNYFDDLNAMHEIEKMLSNNQKWDYLAHLHEILKTFHTAEIVFASAEHRAEAYGKTFNLW